MAMEIATLLATLEADIRDVDSKFRTVESRLDKLDGSTRKTSKSWQNFGGVVKRVAQFAAAGFGLQALQSFMSGSVRAATDLTESINAVEKVFGSASGSVLAFAADTRDSVFLAESELNQLVTLTGSLLQTFGFSADEAAEASIRLTQRAADMASVFNTTVADALLAINSALRGETEPITRYGAKVNEAAINAYLLSEGIVESTGAITDQEKTLARINLIMEQTASVQGDAADTADELANRQRALSEVWEKAQAIFGTQLVPLMEAGVDVAINFASGIEVLAGWMSNMSDGAKRVATVITGVLLVALAAVFAHPVIAGLAAVAAGIALIGRSARKQEETISRFRALIAELGDVPTHLLAEAFEIPQKDIDRLTALGLSMHDVQNILRQGPEVFFAWQKGLVANSKNMVISELDARELARSLHGLGEAYFEATDKTEMQEEALNTWADKVHTGATTLGELADKQRNFRNATDEGTTAVQRQRAEIGKISTPLSRLKEAVDRVTTAQGNLEAVMADEKATAQDLFDAQFELIVANENLEITSRNLGGQLDRTKGQFFEWGESVGFTKDELDKLWDFYNDFAELPNVTKHINFISSVTGEVPDNIYTTPVGNNFYLHEGGVVPGPPGADVPAVLQAGEIVINPNKPGGGANVNGAMVGGGGTVVVPVYVADNLVETIYVEGQTVSRRRGRG